jgi:hypothetical protein
VSHPKLVSTEIHGLPSPPPELLRPTTMASPQQCPSCSGDPRSAHGTATPRGQRGSAPRPATELPCRRSSARDPIAFCFLYRDRLLFNLYIGIQLCFFLYAMTLLCFIFVFKDIYINFGSTQHLSPHASYQITDALRISQPNGKNLTPAWLGSTCMKANSYSRSTRVTEHTLTDYIDHISYSRFTISGRTVIAESLFPQFIPFSYRNNRN